MPFIQSLRQSLDENCPLQSDTSEKFSDYELKIMVAFLIAHAAYADHKVSDVERSEMLQILQRNLSLNEDESTQILQVAEFFIGKDNKLERTGHMVSENFNVDQRETLLAMYIRVLEADGVVSTAEMKDIGTMLDIMNLSRDSIDRAKEKIKANQV